MLRASTQQTGKELDYNAVTGGIAAGSTGVPNDTLLIEFAEAVLDDDPARLDAARRALFEEMGGEALSDAAGVAGLFNAIDRVADATGAPVEDWKAEQVADVSSKIGIDAFAAAKEALDADRKGQAAE